MPVRKYKPEQIVTLLRQVEVGIANGKNTPQAREYSFGHGPEFVAEELRK